VLTHGNASANIGHGYGEKYERDKKLWGKVLFSKKVDTTSAYHNNIADQREGRYMGILNISKNQDGDVRRTSTKSHHGIEEGNNEK